MGPKAGCALCGATWGDYWDEVEGKKLFFCCDVCAKQYKAVLAEAKRRTGWDSLDSLEVHGDYRGRTCRVTRGADSREFLIAFDEDGALRTFLDLE